MAQWFHYWLVRYKMAKLYRGLTGEFKKEPEVNIEHGRPRKTEIWGRKEYGKAIYLIEMDALSNNPYLYRIEYDLKFHVYYCYARFGRSTSYTNILQFTSSSYIILEQKMRELFEHIPVVRERLLRFYFYDILSKKSLFSIFKKSDIAQKQDSALAILQEMRNSEKISRNEQQRLSRYIEEFN